MRRNLMVCAGIAMFGVGAAQAAPTDLSIDVVKMNFNAYNVGATLNTTGPGIGAQPIADPYSLSGFPDTGPFTGTATITNVGGLSKAVRLSTTQGGIGANFMDLQVGQITTNEFFAEFDLNVGGIATSGFPQAVTNAPGGQAFALNVFSAIGGNRIFRFAVSPTSAGGGNFVMGDVGGASVTVIGSYLEGEDHRLGFFADFDTATVDAYVDGTLVLAGKPFVVQPSSGDGISELFFFQNNIEGSVNDVSLDNISVTVPEPGSISLGLVAATGLLVRRRRA